jgi:chromosome segregation ATPase
VANAVKSWPVTFKKKDEGEAQPQFCVGIFECPQCKSRFRSRVESVSVAKPAETANVQDLVERVKGIHNGLLQTLATLRARIKTLETERGSLMLDIEDLKQVAESRAEELEDEVARLREEIRSVREFLGSTEEGNV